MRPRAYPPLVLAAAAVLAATTAASGRVASAPTITFLAARPASGEVTVCAGSAPVARRVVFRRGPYSGHSWHPDGRSIALVARRGLTWTLDLASATGAHRRRLSTGRVTAVPFGQPAWSPDGKLIAFIRDRSLFVVRSDGRGLRRLLDHGAGPSWYSAPSWSPSGDRIFAVYAILGPLFVGLHSVRPDGTAWRREREGVHPAHAVYSPDRTKVAWYDGPGQIHLAAADGSAARTVTPSMPWGATSDPVWSPDGTAIAYLRTAPGPAVEVFRADAESGIERRVTTNRLFERDVAWHPGRPRTDGRCTG